MPARHLQKSTSAFAPVDSSEHRKYAPDREIDILHLALDITPDFKARTISGNRAFGQKKRGNPFESPHRNCEKSRPISASDRQNAGGF